MGMRGSHCVVRAVQFLTILQATSQLDANSEHSVQEALDVLMKDRTVVVIAHRLSTIRNADKICVFADGKIAEQVLLMPLPRLYLHTDVMVTGQTR